MKLIYAAITSLDGYIEDETGSFDWSAPDEEVHQFVNDLERSVGIYLYGRRMYDVMSAWESMPLEGEPPAIRDYAEIWRATDKVVYSRTLREPSTARTRIETEFDPTSVARLKADARSDLSIAGPEIAAQALRAGLVDQVGLFISPVAVGGGKPALPSGIPISLRLLDERRFGNGVVYVSYEVEH